jgi:type I site-specific restriction endonuclease
MVLSRIGSQNTLEALANNEDRILLTATGTGKQDAFQIAWKLFQTCWKRDGSRRPEYCFLADRNILADQAFFFRHFLTTL